MCVKTNQKKMIYGIEGGAVGFQWQTTGVLVWVH
ncbi:MAG: hypothetical protein BWY12_00695 [candidate division BRC1 bacterium ADurb.Bin183]|nr:MAG: hypothetical protein BWY12_00695 [candidate division BRC1 bacterium ADurb.Bin183]